MTTSTASIERGEIGNNIKAGLGHEFDLIDLIGFLWRWRRYLLAGMVLGALIGASSAYIKTLWQTNATIGPVGYRWKASYLIEKDIHDSQHALPTAILSFLNTPLGASTFYGEINSKLNSPLFVVSDWVIKQQNGTGFIVSMEVDKDEVVIDVESTFPISAEDIEKSLKDSLNKTIETFNGRFAQAMASLREESLALHLQIGESKIAALKHFDQNESLSPDFKKSLLEGLTRELTQKWTVDTMIMLLGTSAPEDQTAAFIQNYQNRLKKMETLRSLEQSLAKQSGIEDPSIISSLGSQKKLKLQDTENVERKIPTSFFARPWVGLVMGAALGFMLAVTIAAVFSFYSANRDRLKKVVA
jgi:hypothetical protein